MAWCIWLFLAWRFFIAIACIFRHGAPVEPPRSIGPLTRTDRMVIELMMNAISLFILHCGGAFRSIGG